MTTAKDYLESALKSIEAVKGHLSKRCTKASLICLDDVRLKILAAARVLDIELEKESGK